MLRYALCLIFFLATPCYSQPENDITLTLPTSYSGKTQDSYLTPEANDSGPREVIEHLGLPNFDLYTDIRVTFPDYWTSYANRPNVTYDYRYKGLRGLIQKHVMRGFDKLYSQALSNSFDQSYLSLIDRRSAFAQLDLEAGDAGQRFWEQRRFFFDYLPIEKGGHSVQRITVGDRFKIVELGPLSLNNEGRVAWSGWRLSVSTERDPADQVQQTEEYQKRIGRVRRRRENPTNYSFGIAPPKGNIYTGNYFNISGSVKVGLRLDNFVDNRSSITGRLEIMAYSGYRKIPWLSVDIRARARPFREEYSAQIVVSLISF